MTRVSPFRLLLPLLWLVPIALIVPILLGVLTPLIFVVWVIGLPLILVWPAFQEQMAVTWVGYLLWGLWWPILLISAMVPTLALVLAVILFIFDGQAPVALRQFLTAIDPPLPEIALLCVVSGITGFSTNCVYAFLDIPWRLKQIRQVRALPRSKARSVAIGLAELEGMARATGADGEITKPGAKAAQPFYLEDETGRILVDPVDAAVRPRSTSGASLRLNEVEEGLRDGDRVYVIGNVQSRVTHLSDALDADRLVIRPLRQRLVASPVGRLLFPERNQPADRDAPNIFIVDRGREHDVILRLRLALWDFCIIAGAYLAASLWLVQAAWPWLAPVDYYLSTRA